MSFTEITLKIMLTAAGGIVAIAVLDTEARLMWLMRVCCVVFFATMLAVIWSL